MKLFGKLFRKKNEIVCVYRYYWKEDKYIVDFYEVIRGMDKHNLKCIGLEYHDGDEIIKDQNCLLFVVQGSMNDLIEFEKEMDSKLETAYERY